MNSLKAWQPSASKRFPLAWIGCLVLVGIGIQLFLRQDNEWEKVFLPASASLLSGDDIYVAGGAYLYPPFTAFATLPFLALPHAACRLAFVGLNLLCVAFVVVSAWRLAGGRSLSSWSELLAALAGGSCGIFFIHNCLAHQQTDIFIAALLIAGCLALSKGRSILAATGFGLAAAMKCTPLLWAPYLVWRGRPVAAAWLVAVALGANLLPDVVSRSPSDGIWLKRFATLYLVPLTDRNHVPGSWGSEIAYNQSISGAAQRWLLTTPRLRDGSYEVERTASVENPMLMKSSVFGLEIALLATAVVACGRPFQRVSGQGRDALEYSVVLTLMLLLSPMSSVAHFGTLILPGFCLARRAFLGRDRVSTGILMAAVIAACASNKDLLGGNLYTLALWSGCVMLTTLLLLAGCLRELLLTKPATHCVAGNRTDGNEREFTPLADSPAA